MRMRSMSVWTRLVLVIYLATVVVVCLYVPAHASEPILTHKPLTGVAVLSGPTMVSFGYRRVWDLTETYSVVMGGDLYYLSLIHISEPTRLGMISYAVFCLKKKKKQSQHLNPHQTK